MSKKDFKINPKVFPREYTFEEFKSLNPNINENVLINYYNKYLAEYLENKTSHVQDFDKYKNLLGEELKKQHWNFEAYDSMVDGGEGGVGRYYVDNKYSTKLLHFNEDDNEYALTTKPGSLKPELFTLSVWFKKDGYAVADFTPANYMIDNYRTTNYGWEMAMQTNGSLAFGFRSLKTETNYTYASGYRTFANDYVTRRYYDITGPSGNGWFNCVVTMDGRYLKMYINGELERGGGILEIDGTDGHTVMYGSPEEQVAAIGGILQSNTHGLAMMNGWIDELAVWDTALDAKTINILYNSGVSKHDLNVNIKNLDSRDGHDSIKPYVDHLIAWWRFEEGSGETIKDHSKSGNDLQLYNTPTWSTDVPK